MTYRRLNQIRTHVPTQIRDMESFPRHNRQVLLVWDILSNKSTGGQTTSSGLIGGKVVETAEIIIL